MVIGQRIAVYARISLLLLCTFVGLNCINSAMSAAPLGKEAVKIISTKPLITTIQQTKALELYDLQLKKTIEAHWLPHKCEGGSRVVSYTIYENGDVGKVRLDKSSGVALCDQSALDSITHSAPFSPLPIDIQEICVQVSFGYASKFGDINQIEHY